MCREHSADSLENLAKWASELANHDRDDLSAFASHLSTYAASMRTVEDKLREIIREELWLAEKSGCFQGECRYSDGY